MHRIVPKASGPYRVVFTPQTWKQIGLMPTALFDAFQGAVDNLASSPGKVPPSPLAVDGLVVTYERDDAARVITLVDITRAPTGSP
ncbi:type II toxin-antitoxin system RelE family toxin [Pyxidicoccus trucidator]|uniref:type II toxin-antitoxin system RelE family toxin n=1 Tax=Pyxidicoccus trucidator TaxID=2709662 RepID=UPI0013DCDC4E|nr:hypothetical protein [Pyxidicoccus trucidator]